MTAPPGPAGVVLRVEDVRKAYGAVAVLKGVSLTLRAGRVHALAGGNGSGKSTLIKVLAGIEQADAGTVRGPGRSAADLAGLTPAAAGRAGLRFVHQDLGLVLGMTVAENFALSRGFPTRLGAVSWSRLRRATAAALERLDLSIDPGVRVASLRPAERTMVAIARALADDEPGQVLVLDEPTASLPHHEVDVLLDALARRAAAGQAILYVSHRPAEVLSLAHHVTVLRDGVVAESRPTADLDRLRLAELIAGRSVEALYPRRAAAAGPAATPERPVVQVRGLCAGPLREVGLEAHAGEIVGVAGLLGSGRSTLLRSLFGAVAPRSGSILIDGRPLPPSVPAAIRAGVALVPEDRHGDALFGEFSVVRNTTIATLDRHVRWSWLRPSSERAAARGAVAGFGITAAAVGQPITRLSGGNQQKVVLARWLERAPRVLLLDEPTQGVDVMARADIYQRLRTVAASGAAVVVASSDVEELAHLCDRVVVLRAGRVTAHLRGAEVAIPAIVTSSYADQEAS
ncbi:ABC transporter ATP-binding protein [Sphaerisporangium krabiense]|uniref:Ribose transport system ATP-binding protein n=1 Tax=Sphaerisporangium krabiense TaxID=763782 RepID=A0A7W9DQ60_9ACTN|nr:sugar ABC transporter ATP-binding protein [Sphaerisporangium krabiense]MBB5626065.1 ribose transport system ATP-binding protein [Sphaerisporangium krabiense]GII64869.1 ABC transporter ATP-binding protein [Sphaerisporangium krabiense]